MSKSRFTETSEAEFLDKLRESARDELRFLSNRGRTEREKWVVSEFLACRNLAFNVDELNSPNQSSKVDVEFRDARFQIKEILTPGTKRYRDAEARYKHLMAVKSIRDVTWPMFSYDVPSVTTIYKLVANEAEILSTKPKYVSVKGNLDLLFYVTRTHASLIQKDEINSEHLSLLGWRSISCLAGKQAVTLYVSRDAPGFLRMAQL